MNTRLILNKFFEFNALPIYVITDADPYGVEIMLTYRHGSQVSLEASLIQLYLQFLSSKN